MYMYYTLSNCPVFGSVNITATHPMTAPGMLVGSSMGVQSNADRLSSSQGSGITQP